MAFVLYEKDDTNWRHCTVSLLTTSLDPIGAEIVGVDIDALLHDDHLPDELMELLEDNGVLVMRRLGLDDAQQVEFGRRLGELVTKDTPGWRGEFPEIFRVTLDRRLNNVGYLKATFGWHIDGTNFDVPSKASLLSGRVVPAGSETQFVSTYAAYERLTEAEKERLEPVKVWHTLESAYRKFNPNPTAEVVAEIRNDPVKLQPLVWTHRSGRKSLVIGVSAERVEGMPEDEGAALLAELLERATQPCCVYAHHWAVGDLVIWDNRGVLHRAMPYSEDSGREMHRVTLVGDEPFE